MGISSLSPPTWWPKEFESDGEAGRLRRAWCAYPPEAGAYLDFIRGVLRTASLAACGVPDRIAQGVIDYASPREGSMSHRGAAWNSDSGWIDPSYETLGSCSREDTEPLVLQEQPYRVSLHRRELSLVNLQRPNWTGPNDEASFHARVISPLVELTEAEDHLYTWLSLFFADCHGQNVAYVSRYEPGARARKIAAAHGVKLTHLPLTQFPDAERDAQRWFHFLHLTRPEWETLLQDLAAGRRPAWYQG